jgi:hypothetical protein
MKKQWHPTFAHLLRPLVESHYDVQTNVPVGDGPAKPISCCCGASRPDRCPSPAFGAT